MRRDSDPSGSAGDAHRAARSAGHARRVTISDPLLPPPDPDPADEARVDGGPTALPGVDAAEVNDVLPLPTGSGSDAMTADALNGEAPD
jgi:hypothetical protein